MYFSEAESFLSGGRNKSSRPIANNTRVERIDADTIGIRLHGTYVIKLHRDGSYELSTGGWYTMTTKARMNEFRPGGYSYGLRVGSKRHKGTNRWWMFGPHWQPVGPYFDGIHIDSETILNPQPEPVDDTALVKAIDKYVRAYVQSASDEGLYVDAMDSSGGAIACWDCSNPTMAGRTSEGGPKAHLLRHIERSEFPPALIYNALRAKGAGPYYFAEIGGAEYMVNLRLQRRDQRLMWQRWIRDFIKSQLLDGTTGARPFVDYSARRAG
jgi:hypothetical protein